LKKEKPEENSLDSSASQQKFPMNNESFDCT
jgi:hypothetical protein